MIRPRLPHGTREEAADEQAGTHLLLHPDAPRWAAVNATGLEVARLCDGTRTAGEIAAALAGRYGLAPEAVMADVLACLEDLERAGMLDEEGHPHAASPAAAGEGRLAAWRLHLYLTERCNLRCAHCGVTGGPPPADALSDVVVRGLIEQAVAAGCEGIAFGGGEPLLRADCLRLLRESASCVQTLLATNGLLIDDAIASGLVEAGVLVQISLDGATAEVHDAIRGPDAFERAWQAIERLQRAGIGPRLSLNVTLMRHNIEQVPAIVALAAERGIGGGVRFTQLQRMGRAAECWDVMVPTPAQYAAAYRWLYGESSVLAAAPGGRVVVSAGLPGLELEPPPEGMWCRLGRLLLVDAAGDIYPCSLVTGPQFRLGNVADTPLAQALASEALAGLVRLCAGRSEEIEACRACTWRHFCQSSCPGSAWCAHGTWYAADELCELRRELYRALIGRRTVAGGVECQP